MFYLIKTLGSAEEGASFATCYQEDWLLVWMKLHLPGDPGPIKVSVPPAFFLVLGVFVLVRGSYEGNAEVTLLSVHCNLLLPGWDGWSGVLLG